MRLLSRIITISALVAATGQAGAQETTDFKEQFKLIRGVNAVASVGADLFGDRVNLYTGGLEFVQTDVSLPGNNDLPVTLGRRLTAGQYTFDDQPFGKWSLDIPHLHGIFARGSISTLPGWVGTDGTNARCTAFGAPADASGLQGSSTWAAGEFWRGNFMYIPGHGDQEMLRRAPDYTRTPDPITIDGITVAEFPVVTSERWSIGCLPAMSNGATLGQGFLAVSPDGTAYKFDWLVSYSATTITKPSPAPIPSASLASDPGSGDGTHFTQTVVRSAVIQPTLPRTEVWILPSKIVDRFGNWVAYTYDPARPRNLMRIESSDGRAIDLTYVPDAAGAPTALVESVFDGTRRWTYAYDVAIGNKQLRAVMLPDGSSWQLGQAQNLLNDPQYPREPWYCSEKIAAFPTVLQATLEHPSGAFGTFTLEPVEHGRSNVVYSCVDRIITTPIFYTTNSLTSKIITGPGLGTMAWSYQYDPANGGFTSCDGCPGTAGVNVTDPEGSVTRHVFGNRYFIDEGRLLQTFVGWDGSGADRITAYAYQPSSSANPYPPQFGHSEALLGDSGSDLRLMPLLSRTITQQGVDFVWRADTFDSLARPLQVTKYSSLGMARTEATTYADYDSRWVIGQVGQVDSAGKTIVKFDYDPVTLKPVLVTRFGVADSAMTYNMDGTLASHTKGRQTRQFANYKRGIAQHIAYAGTTITETRQIDNLGNPDWTRDAAQHITSYGYDAMGRLALVRYPAGDATAWADTSISFAKSAVSAYDLPAGHWVRAIRTGNGVTAQYFDALLRPVYSQQWDAANTAATFRMSRAGFNSVGQQTYQSYPKRAYSELGDGIHSGFDAVGRPTVTGTISEIGTLYSGFNYSLGGFERHYSNNRQNASLIRYQAFDEPAEAAVVSISEPEGVTTTIARDNFGKPLSVTRSGGGKTATRRYVYDVNERLCKTIEPESGVVIEEYDASNNLAWRAAGLALTSTTSCDRASVPAASKTSFMYDALNRLTDTTFGDGSPPIRRTYTYDSLPETTASNGTVWTNSYNKRRLLTRESLEYGGTMYNIDHGYDANAARSSLTYPDDSKIAYAPNALGEATQVGSFASNVSYHPNGAVAGFRYGNGIHHTMRQNVRGLPEWSIDGDVMRDNYVYDGNANVAFILDYHEGVSNRGITYDNLDRLIRVDSATQWGAASYAYDALDNLTSTNLVSGATARATTHTYDTVTNLLTDIASNNAIYNLGLEYDTRGNVTRRGSQRFVFDQGNRMSSAVGKGTYVYDGAGRRVSTVGTDGVNRITVYSQQGKLLFFRATSTPMAAGVKYIHLGNHVIAESSPAGTVYAHTDGLGSPIATTDGNGVLVSRTRYEPYGLTFAGASPTIGFSGHLNAADIGLVYMQQRYYDPVAGRFLSLDPVVTDANTGSSFNRYGYAANNPYKYIDPDGRQERAAEAFGNQFRNDAAAGNSAVYEPFHTPVVIATIGMAVGPPIGAGVIARMPTVVVRTTQAGDKAVRITKADGSVKDISPARVKEYVPNTHPKAPPGTLEKVKFENPLPGSKGFKREPTAKELKILENAK